MKTIRAKDRLRCWRKTHHPDKKAAWDEYKRMKNSGRPTKWLSVFKCEVCGKFVLGRMTKRDRQKRLERWANGELNLLE